MVQMRPLFQLVFFDRSCCRRRFSERTHIHLGCVWEKFCIQTQPGLLGTIMKWSFQCMLDRTSHDWRGCRFPRNSSEGKKAGKPLASGWRACLVQLAGGLDYYSKRFDAPRWSNRNKPCSICKATYRGHLSWRDNRLNSGWQNASLSPRTFRSHVSPKCPLFQLPGMSSLSMAMDWMHCHQRAADIAGLHAAMLQLWSTHMDEADVRHRQIRLVLQLNHQIQDIFETYSPTFGYMAMPAGPGDEVFQKGLQMSSLHNQLLEHYQHEEIQVFNMTSKIQVLWKSCLHGSKHFQVANKAALKERHLRWLQGKIG